MDTIGLDKLTELSTYVREARQRWRFDEAQLEDRWEVRDEPVEPELRKLRQATSTAILLKDVNGRAALEETGRALSRLAEHCLEQALAVAEARTAIRFGALTDANGEPIRLAVIGMGKLGAEELNFNSDIDLVFAYQDEGQSRGPRKLSAREYLTRVAQELVAIIDKVTEHGRVWVVDTRLRPFGGAGALVWPAAAIEQYYLAEGRTWERYALIKARPVAGDLRAGERLLESLQPFVYRRYLDYGIFDQLRGIQREIRRDARAGGQADNIKRGKGGIRELEFIVQSLQLLRGGRHHQLRARGFLPALAACRELSLLPAGEADRLEDDYRFLRTLENRLQAVTGRQTHVLPAGDDNRAHLARMMRARDWPALSEAIGACRARVREAFAERFREHGPENGIPEPVERLWPLPDGGELERRLAAAGFTEPGQAAHRLGQTAARLADKPLSAEGRRRLDALMPRMMEEITRLDAPDAALGDLLRLVETVARRSAYLSLLREQPEVLRRLVDVFADSHRVAEWIIASPQLLDDLLDPVHGYELADPPDTARFDLEARLAALSRYRQAGFLRTALGELDGKLDIARARTQLSRLAERIVQLTLDLVTGDDEAGMAVIAYGNLGAGGMHYESDLDLVFLHRDGQAPPLRIAQKLINLLQAPGPGGRLYEIDTRLRPNGRAGLLVSALGSFQTYQLNQAWTWEHQALIRARWIAGDARMKADFEAVRGEVLERPRDVARTTRELSEMRRRQRSERDEGTLQRLRADIQFIAELGVLINADREAGISAHHTTDALIEALGNTGWLAPEEARTLVEAWRTSAWQQHLTYLKRDFSPDVDDATVKLCEGTWERLMLDR